MRIEQYLRQKNALYGRYWFALIINKLLGLIAKAVSLC